jgi:hypothetical protein
VSREKPKSLPGEALAELAKADELALILMDLHSLRNFDRLRDRLDSQLPAEAPTLN